MAKPEFQLLLDAALPFVKRMLSEHGEFIPFATRLAKDGSVALVAGDIGVERPRSKDVVTFLSKAMMGLAQGGEIDAAAICFIGDVVKTGNPGPVEAVAFRMAHVDGDCLEVYLPFYAVGPEVTYGKLFTSTGSAFSLNLAT